MKELVKMSKDLPKKSLNSDVAQVPKPRNIFLADMKVEANALSAVFNFKSVDEMLEHTINNTL